MKKGIIAIFLFLVINQIHGQKLSTSKYLIFEYGGESTKPISPVIFYVDTLEVPKNFLGLMFSISQCELSFIENEIIEDKSVFKVDRFGFYNFTVIKANEKINFMTEDMSGLIKILRNVENYIIDPNVKSKVKIIFDDTLMRAVK